MNYGSLNLVADAGVADEPVSLAEAKAYLRLEDSFTDDDDQIQTMITAARLEAEAASGRELAAKTYLLTFDRFPTNYATLRVAYPIASSLEVYQFALSPQSIGLLDPLVAVDWVKYTQSDGAVVTMAPSTDYIVDTNKHPGIICPPYGGSWPTADLAPSSAVQVQFKAGRPPANVPLRYKQGILLLVGQWYERRIPFEAIRFVAELPFSVTSLFTADRLHRF